MIITLIFDYWFYDYLTSFINITVLFSSVNEFKRICSIIRINICCLCAMLLNVEVLSYPSV